MITLLPLASFIFMVKYLLIGPRTGSPTCTSTTGTTRCAETSAGWTGANNMCSVIFADGVCASFTPLPRKKASVDASAMYANRH
eukprot:963106-Pyramimonas_sp.AAC.1